MTVGDRAEATATRPKRADARRNEAALLDAAAAVFVRSSVEAPIRDIATQAGVGTATIYRHFPTRADLILAVYGHQVEALTDAGPALLASSADAHGALQRWFELFVDFLVTKRGLAAVLQSDDPCFDPLHAYFLERIVPVCAQLLHAAASTGEIRADQDPHELMRGVASLCAGASAGTHRHYDARRLVSILIAGLRRSTYGYQPQSTRSRPLGPGRPFQPR